MNKILKRILIGLAVIAGIFLVIAVIMIIRFSYATKEMTPSTTQAINDSVFCIQDRFVNAYLFKGYSGYMMIDAGLSKKRVLEELNKLEINPDDILAVVLTHSDGDHIGALGAFKNAKIFLHEEEEQMVNGETAKMIFKFKWKYQPYNLIRSDEILNINVFQVKVLHTPGHTPGSCCFIVNDDYLLTGDNLLVKDGKYVHFFNMVNMDTEKQIESIKNLPEPTQFEYILTGHTGIISKDEL